MKTRQSNGFTLVEIMIVVVIIGMLAALAIPGFKKIRESSQDKAVLSNARQLAAATDQYMMEYGKSTVSISNLVGLTNYVKNLDTVANESHPNIYTAGVAITVNGVGGARTITYGL
jgi:type IV pilus assembly protein PilA